MQRASTPTIVLIETLWNVKSGEGLGNSERAEWLFLGIYGN